MCIIQPLCAVINYFTLLFFFVSWNWRLRCGKTKRIDHICWLKFIKYWTILQPFGKTNLLTTYLWAMHMKIINYLLRYLWKYVFKQMSHSWVRYYIKGLQWWKLHTFAIKYIYHITWDFHIRFYTSKKKSKISSYEHFWKSAGSFIL